MSLWPSLVALAVVFLTLRVMVGLLAGASAGVLLLNNGNPLSAFVSFFETHLIPSVQSDWRISVILFTFLLGGFAALLEYGGGFRAILHRFVRGPGNPARRVQAGVFGLGLICFFDGLANSMLVGRSMRPLADRTGVSREKLSYIVDSTSSTVACVAVVSTWIAYQLTMIEEGFKAANQEVSPYALFLSSLPYNFYCWFTLGLVAVVIVRNWNPGPMRAAEARLLPQREITHQEEEEASVSPFRAIMPLFVLLVAIFGGLYLSGTESLLPFSFRRVAEAIGQADAAIVLVVASAMACLVAYGCNRSSPASEKPPGEVFLGGVSSLFMPILILISAWVLSSTLGELGAADTLTALMGDRVQPSAFPMTVFLVAMAVSFTTGTSWGTMGVVTPLVLPVALALTAGMTPDLAHPIVAGTVAAIFGGAVFGDHCSPLSDTTIVSSISCGLEPMDHVKTQLPYALLSAALALFLGYGGLAIGLPVWLILALGFLLLTLPPLLPTRKRL